MSDIQNGNEETEVIETQAAAVTEEASDSSWDEVSSFIGDDDDFALPDPATVVTIRTSSGGDKYVPVSEPTAVSSVIAQSGLYFGGAVQYYLNGAEIKTTDLVPGGSTLTVIGSVKGGRA